MTSITITIPNNLTSRVVNGFAKRYNYSPTLESGEQNPESRAEFMRRKIIEHIKEAVRVSEIEDARNAAASIASASVDNEINIA